MGSDRMAFTLDSHCAISSVQDGQQVGNSTPQSMMGLSSKSVGTDVHLTLCSEGGYAGLDGISIEAGARLGC